MHKYTVFAGVALSLLLDVAFAQPLPSTVEQAKAMEQADALPATALYTRSYDAAAGKPGDLLAQEPFDGYAVKGLARAVRIAYRSADAQDRTVVATAMILIPAGEAPAGGWPVIAWAHGTSGVANMCAPSLMKDAYYGDEGLADMLKAGFAVVATDYLGLGGPGKHPYIDKPSQARDVIYSVPAARAAVPSLGKRWVADGHSQGGAAAWGVAELESSMDDGSYLGAVSVSGAGSLTGFFQFIDDNAGVSMYLPWAAEGIHVRFPEFEPRDILTPRMMEKYTAVTTQGCWYFGFVNYKDTPKHAALMPNWRTNQWVQRWVDENALAKVRVTKPLFVISGEADKTVPIEGVRETVRQACQLGSNLTFKSYPGLDHDPTMIKSTHAQLLWIRDRFAGKSFASDCPASK
jgi:pimeloyl-ACP methyl ester carboxylesterase